MDLFWVSFVFICLTCVCSAVATTAISRRAWYFMGFLMHAFAMCGAITMEGCVVQAALTYNTWEALSFMVVFSVLMMWLVCECLSEVMDYLKTKRHFK